MMNTSQSDVIGTTRANPGETLRQARENKGWSTAQVAGQLNLTENALRQLEQGSFDQLPGHTFARGYIRAYAKLLGMDQAQMVTAFDQYTGTDASGSNVQALGRVVEPVRLSRNLLRLFSLALLAVLIGFGYFWWQERSARPAETGSLNMEHVEVESADGTTEIHTLDEPEDQAVAEDQANTPPVPSEPAGDSGTAEAPAEGTPPATAAPVAPGTPAVPEAAQAPAPAVPAPAQPPAAQQPAVPANPAAPAEAPAAPVVAAAGQGVVKVQFTADCWTQVTDADGKVILEGLKRKGDSLEVAAKAPVQLRLGFAQGAQVSYNGQPVEVTPARGGTARLKLGGQ
ncbi:MULTISPECIES: RodZ domain-containing protein [Pseudomonas]|uniref:Helix-turn-helix domain-containing protein n=2 Tax=Pseudomonas nitroreducens TaxID=46680 RepID=A0ABS0KPV6_PSENT|nr:MULTISPECIES: RodZ family helix-turn-helix domain-containing protein [Pseudomonas]MBG6290080.1 helix-turn-helix domain-containing protein [Pseudomonas nitroreducens]MCJ1880294.1 helix-turn-helix domain-containing protein [Pseudomonas nitroreducens]MCJ1897360.1 helix-turn-helix domain-containing protein [Pseudomonas nitroreducens]MDG9853278.1 helix-turn-helix domain-containing protein [Pseudomonas nitroreducens]MDH1075312.1 helix-turn-helix domain-containing protein [Pseudomonas nitroreducen